MEIDRQSCRQNKLFQKFFDELLFTGSFWINQQNNAAKIYRMKERYMAEPIKKTTARNHELERWPDNRQTVDDTAKGTYSDFGRHNLKILAINVNQQIIQFLRLPSVLTHNVFEVRSFELANIRQGDIISK